MIILVDTWNLRLLLARQNAGLKQKEAAEVLGVAGATISRWESGERGIGPDDLKRLAKLYGVTVGWLVGEAPLFEEKETEE